MGYTLYELQRESSKHRNEFYQEIDLPSGAQRQSGRQKQKRIELTVLSKIVIRGGKSCQSGVTPDRREEIQACVLNTRVEVRVEDARSKTSLLRLCTLAQLVN